MLLPSPVLGFLRSKQQKEDKKRKSKSKSDGSGNDNSSIETNKDNSLEDSPGGNSNSEPKVDEEGYIIRPQTAAESGKEADRFYSSSEDDSDSDDGSRPGGKPIQFVIKPMPNNGGPSIAELQKTVQGISISPSLQHFVSCVCVMTPLLYSPYYEAFASPSARLS